MSCTGQPSGTTSSRSTWLHRDLEYEPDMIDDDGLDVCPSQFCHCCGRNVRLFWVTSDAWARRNCVASSRQEYARFNAEFLYRQDQLSCGWSSSVVMPHAWNVERRCMELSAGSLYAPGASCEDADLCCDDWNADLCGDDWDY